MRGGVFVSYRREDTQGSAGRIYDRLSVVLGRNAVFFDVDNIEPGLDFVEVLGDRVGSCDALLAIIGSQWITIRDEHGHRRIDNPNDFVRVEVEAALERKVPVIPVLVDGARMPHAEDLPEALKPLARRQAAEVSHARFDFDSERLLRAIRRSLDASAHAEELRQHESEAALNVEVDRRRSDGEKSLSEEPEQPSLKPTQHEEGEHQHVNFYRVLSQNEKQPDYAIVGDSGNEDNLVQAEAEEDRNVPVSIDGSALLAQSHLADSGLACDNEQALFAEAANQGTSILGATDFVVETEQAQTVAEAFHHDGKEPTNYATATVVVGQDRSDQVEPAEVLHLPAPVEVAGSFEERVQRIEAASNCDEESNQPADTDGYVNRAAAKAEDLVGDNEPPQAIEAFHADDEGSPTYVAENIVGDQHFFDEAEDVRYQRLPVEVEDRTGIEWQVERFKAEGGFGDDTQTVKGDCDQGNLALPAADIFVAEERPPFIAEAGRRGDEAHSGGHSADYTNIIVTNFPVKPDDGVTGDTRIILPGAISIEPIDAWERIAFDFYATVNKRVKTRHKKKNFDLIIYYFRLFYDYVIGYFHRKNVFIGTWVLLGIFVPLCIGTYLYNKRELIGNIPKINQVSNDIPEGLSNMPSIITLTDKEVSIQTPFPEPKKVSTLIVRPDGRLVAKSGSQSKTSPPKVEPILLPSASPDADRSLLFSKAAEAPDSRLSEQPVVPVAPMPPPRPPEVSGEGSNSKQVETVKMPHLFNCANASLSVDYVICASPHLLELEANLEDIYQVARQQGKVHDQVAWSLNYGPACGLPKKGRPVSSSILSSQSCVTQAIEDRILYLKHL